MSSPRPSPRRTHAATNATFQGFLLASLTWGACGDSAMSRPDAGPDAGPDAAPDGPADPFEPIAPCTPASGDDVTSEIVATGFLRPVLVTAAPGDPRLFVVEQAGRIIALGQRREVVLDLSATANGPVLATGNEQGLLGLAFHPAFAQNGRLFVNYTRRPDGATVVAEYQANDGGAVDPTTGRVLMTIDQPFANHNGGMIEFAPDGTLFIGTGDGGNANDQPGNYAQDPASLLGKMLRIDIDATTNGKPYGIPSTNPYAQSLDGPSDPRPELWASGLRNPWRFAFDPTGGMLYIGDVGQNALEEVNAMPISDAGINYGWRLWEGSACTEIGGGGCTTPHTLPISQHAHGAGWCSVIGGRVYRGTCMPDRVGTYLYGDYCAGEVWGLRYDGQQVTDKRAFSGSFGQAITSIYAGNDGEIYLTNQGGQLRRLIAMP